MLRRPPRLLTRDFRRDQALLNAHNRRRLGLRETPVAAVAGSVGRPDLAAPRRLAEMTATARYRGIRDALASGVCLPPVDLYLLDGHYYIHDGHHRILAARELGIVDVDADVTEFLPAPEAPAAAWHRALAAFERETGLAGLHIRRLDGYELLRRQIAEHGWYLGERGQAPRRFAEAAAAWHAEVYTPTLADLALRGLLERFADLTPTELYLAICDHKWYRSERLAHDIGFADAAADFRRTRRRGPIEALAGRLADGVRLLTRALGGGLSLSALGS